MKKYTQWIKNCFWLIFLKIIRHTYIRKKNYWNFFLRIFMVRFTSNIKIIVSQCVSIFIWMHFWKIDVIRKLMLIHVWNRYCEIDNWNGNLFLYQAQYFPAIPKGRIREDFTEINSTIRTRYSYHFHLVVYTLWPVIKWKPTIF